MHRTSPHSTPNNIKPHHITGRTQYIISTPHLPQRRIRLVTASVPEALWKQREHFVEESGQRAPRGIVRLVTCQKQDRPSNAHRIEHVGQYIAVL
jgi:hypothetical protein